MKTSRHLAVLFLFSLLGGSFRQRAAGQAKYGRTNSAPQRLPLTPDESQRRPKPTTILRWAIITSRNIEVTSHAEDANKAIDFFKKAFTLDPNSQQIGEELAEMYFQSQRHSRRGD